MSQPVQVAFTPATELGDSGIQSSGGHQFSHALAAPVPPPIMPRHPLVSPADSKKPMRPWDIMTTSEKSTTPISTRFAAPPDGEIPAFIEDDPDIEASATIQSTSREILGSFEDTLAKTAAVAAGQPDYCEAENLVLDFRPKIPKKRKRPILILCGGPNDREVSLYNLFIAAGFECVN